MSTTTTMTRLTILMLIGWSLADPGSAIAQKKADSTVYPGHITNSGHPGNPVKEVTVVGFKTMREAFQFVGQSFRTGKLKPCVNTKLSLGQTVRFGDAAWIVFYYYDARKKPKLLSVTRCHSDLHLEIGNIGYQFLLGVRTSASPPDPTMLR